MAEAVVYAGGGNVGPLIGVLQGKTVIVLGSHFLAAEVFRELKR